MMKRKIKTSLAWGGFSGGRLCFIDVDTGFGGFNTGEAHVSMPAIFKKRELARAQFRDVRRVEIREVVEP